MKDVRFILVENEIIDFRLTVERLTRMGVDRRDIWPESEQELVKSWAEVGTLLTERERVGWRPDSQTVVLVLDLALDHGDQDYQKGVESIHRSLDFFQKYSILISTKSPLDVRERIGTLADAVYWKVEGVDPDERYVIFRRAIRDAIYAFEKRTGRPLSRKTEDYASCKHDLAFQMFIASFGENVLMDLLEEIASGVPVQGKPKVVVASGGFSGAFVLLVDYVVKQGGSRQVAVKLSRDQRLLSAEASRNQEVAKASHKFDGLPIHQVSGTTKLMGHADVYFIAQHFYNGDTLEREIVKEARPGGGQAALKAVMAALEGISLQGAEDLSQAKFTTLISIPDRIRLTAHELFPQIEAGIKNLNSIEEFSKRFAKEVKNIPQLKAAFDNWKSLVAEVGVGEVPAYEQHGDMNTRNILLMSNKAGWSVRLIDFARFGLWPAGYDLVRFRYQLALRLLDPPSGMRDILPSRILLWDKALRDHQSPNGIRRSHPEEFALYSALVDAFRDLDDLARRCVAKLPDGPNELVLQLVELNELMRMITYADVGWTKRIWFALLASRKLADIRQPRAK